MGPAFREDNRPDHGWLTRENALALLLLVGTAGIFFLCVKLVEPFLTGLVFGMALALFLRGVHRRLRARCGVNAAAALATLLGGLIVIAPLWFVMNQLAQEAVTFAQKMSKNGSVSDLDRVLESSWAGPALGWVARAVDLRTELGKVVTGATAKMPVLVQGVFWTGGQFLLALIVCFYLLRDRSHLLSAVRHMVPLSDSEYDEVKKHLADSMRATVVGSITMGAIQGTLGGVAFALLGLPAPVLWGVVMAVLACIPMLGTFIIWMPAALMLAVQGEMTKALALGAWGLFAIGMIDNVLYPLAVGERIRLHPLAVLISLLGGIAVFGTAGLVLGPLILSSADVLVEIWRRRTRAGRAAEDGVRAS